MKRNPQTQLLKAMPKSYGGDLFNTRAGRSHGRPISTKHSMHFVLRSTQAKGAWSFLKHKHAIQKTIEKFATRNGVRLCSLANVGNHIHLHLQLTNRHAYKAFIRAITSAIVMKVTGASRWNKTVRESAKKFWDRRPFSRIVVGFKAMLTMKDYVEINKLEGEGYARDQARFMVEWSKHDRNRLDSAL